MYLWIVSVDVNSWEMCDNTQHILKCWLKLSALSDSKCSKGIKLKIPRIIIFLNFFNFSNASNKLFTTC